MKKLALILNKKRREEGSIDFDIPETKIICDKKSRPIEIKPVERLFAHKLIEEFMLTANKAAALYLEDKGIGVFRVHESPDSEKLENFVAIANRMGYKVPVFKSSMDVQKFVEETKDHSESYLLNTMLLRSMKQAYYHHENFGHFGLGFSHYTHFTSPIRRYPDLLVHRLIKKLRKIDNKSKNIMRSKYLEKAVKHASTQERVAVSMERAMIKRKAIHYLKDKLGQKFNGIVSGVTENGVYVALDELGVEGMIVKNLLTGYSFDGEHNEFYNKNIRIRLGSQIKVRLLSLNLKRELIDFNLIR